MDITGARWGLEGAEAILKLRALTADVDSSDYWAFHLQQEPQRIHQARYQPEPEPQTATVAITSSPHDQLTSAEPHPS